MFVPVGHAASEVVRRVDAGRLEMHQPEHASAIEALRAAAVGPGVTTVGDD